MRVFTRVCLRVRLGSHCTCVCVRVCVRVRLGSHCVCVHVCVCALRGRLGSHFPCYVGRNCVCVCETGESLCMREAGTLYVCVLMSDWEATVRAYPYERLGECLLVRRVVFHDPHQRMTKRQVSGRFRSFGLWIRKLLDMKPTHLDFGNTPAPFVIDRIDTFVTLQSVPGRSVVSGQLREDVCATQLF